MATILFAENNQTLLKCRKALLTLRPHLNPEEFLLKANLLLSEGAKIIYIDHDTDAPAVAVFRMNYYFYRGKNIYIDDLITLPESRGKGYATALLEFIDEFGRQNQCANVHLDSGYWAERRTAHRLYLNHGFHLASHHFEKSLL
ncbi:MAG: GNAT family N-acetyltransferase [Chitinophagales bacterium]